MTKPETVFSFPAPLLQSHEGMIQHYIPIPDEIATSLLESGTRRVAGSINGFGIRRAIHRRKSGEHFLLIGKSLVKAFGGCVGEFAEVVLTSDPEPDRVDVDPVFEEVLEMDPEASDRFNEMTPGMQRSIMVYLESAKRVDTKMKRSLEIAEKLRTRTLHGDRQE